MVKTDAHSYVGREPSVELQRIALLTAISIVPRRLAERLAKLERQEQPTSKEGGGLYDAGHSALIGK